MGDRLATLKVPELKGLAKMMSLSISGRKQELINRIVQKCSQFNALQQSAGSMSDSQSHFFTQHMVNGYKEMEQLLQGSSHYMVTPPTGNMRMLKAPAVTPQPTSAPIPNGSWNMVPNHDGILNSTFLLHANTYTSRGQPPQTDLAVGYAPELNNARCLCPIKATQGSAVTYCAKCAMAVHSKCHQTQTIDTWHCEACRAAVFEPFFHVHATYGHPVFLRFTASVRQQIVYEIPPDDLIAMKRAKGTEPGSLELQLRCFAMKEPLSEGHCWPTCSTVVVNGYACPVVQRAVPGQANASKVLREQPLNLLPVSRHGSNTIEIRTADSLPNVYVFVIQRVEKQALDHLLQQVVVQSEQITYDQAKADVVKSFGNDDDDIVATCTMLSVRCPLGLGVIDLPARGIHCQHLQCFDLKTFLMFNRTARSRAWKCIVCHKFIALDELRIDPYLKKLLADVHDDEELEEVEIFPDATWRKRIADDIKPDKRAKPTDPSIADDKLPQLDIVPIDVLASPATAPALDSIDLTLSSDEDEDRPLVDVVPPPTQQPADMHSMWNAPSSWRHPLVSPTSQWQPSAPVPARAFGGILDATYDDPWSTPIPAPAPFPGAVSSAASHHRSLPPLNSHALPPSAHLFPPVQPPAVTGFAPFDTFADKTPRTHNSTENSLHWHVDGSNGLYDIPAKARKRLHRGDQVLPPPFPGSVSSHPLTNGGGVSSLSSSSSSSHIPPMSSSAAAMSNVIYLDDDSD